MNSVLLLRFSLATTQIMLELLAFSQLWFRLRTLANPKGLWLTKMLLTNLDNVLRTAYLLIRLDAQLSREWQKHESIY